MSRARLGRSRIAQRYPVPTTAITWEVPKRRRGGVSAKRYQAEAAIVEVSLMGAAIVAPERWAAVLGTRVAVRWGEVSGSVVIRRSEPMPGSTDLVRYGVEYLDNPSTLGLALYDRLVVARQHLLPTEPGAPRLDRGPGPARWTPPAS